tara:strand:+ start:3178 stop:3501 length:324 start_codon:yes stop_codon:yes gene_type:complete
MTLSATKMIVRPRTHRDDLVQRRPAIINWMMTVMGPSMKAVMVASMLTWTGFAQLMIAVMTELILTRGRLSGVMTNKTTIAMGASMKAAAHSLACPMGVHPIMADLS